MASALGTGDVGGTRPPAQTSRPQNTAVGSGSRPGAAAVHIETSAPANPHTLNREPSQPSGWLK
jgi:hypothetical protein